MSEREQHLLGRVDEELQKALDVAPSPEFLARVRERVARETAPAHPWMRWLVFAAAGAGTLAFGAWLLQSPSTPPGSLGVASSRREPRGESPAAEPPAPRAPERSARASSPLAAIGPTQPEVLVPPGEEELLRRFVAAVRSGHVDASAIVTVAEPQPTPDLAIAPLDVKPLTMDIDTEGVEHD